MSKIVFIPPGSPRGILLPSRPSRPSVRAPRTNRFGWLPVAPLLALLLALLSACVFNREVISVDGKRREVAILSDTSGPEEPPLPGFRAITPGQVEGSLRRVYVKPGTWATFVQKDATQLFSPDQVNWARGHLAALLPKLEPDQRIQLVFRDRFHQFNVEVEIYPEGGNLVYRFTKLAANPVEEPPRIQVMQRPTNFVELFEQPGQTVDYDEFALYLKDPVLGEAAGKDPQRLKKLELIQTALREKAIEKEEGDFLAKKIKEQPLILASEVKRYLDKRKTLNQAREQGIFTEEEYRERRKKALEDLLP